MSVFDLEGVSLKRPILPPDVQRCEHQTKAGSGKMALARDYRSNLVAKRLHEMQTANDLE